MSTARPAAGGPGAMRGPMASMFGAPPAKSKDFKGSLRRLLNELKPERHILLTVPVSYTHLTLPTIYSV